ncbi:MAG: dihydrofolate reductase [Kiritimatiellae bacterium]|nr:dihydrofolate reductase [Kiritimatiellia bacterium]MDW8458517.1 dihydrofolate reductase [Verrucomicrobiota bacterium]
MPRVSIVAAVAENGVIGREGRLPWRLPAELRRFRALTMGHPVIMGRRTWESLGRPLAGRRNIVISRTPGFQVSGAEIVPSLEAALNLARDADEVFVIGGARLFAEALPRADRLYLTVVHTRPDGDVFFPSWDPAEWIEISRETYPADRENPIGFTACVYEPRAAHAGKGRSDNSRA